MILTTLEALIHSEMKRILITLICLLMTCSLFAEEWVISTSQGDKTLVGPEGMTLEEAYCQMAQLYWEERYDREGLQSTVADLTEKAESYISSNESLIETQTQLIQSYEDLSGLYEEKLKTPWFRGLLSVDLGWSIIDNQLNGTLYGGVLIKERVTLEAGLSYPLEIHLKAGVVL